MKDASILHDSRRKRLSAWSRPGDDGIRIARNPATESGGIIMIDLQIGRICLDLLCLFANFDDGRW